MNLKQLIEKTNEKLKELDEQLPKSEDSRIKDTISERRVRSYINNKVLHKPFRADGEIWYDESHLDRLVAIRSLQNTGMSESAIKTMSSIYGSEENKEQQGFSLNDVPVGDFFMYPNADDFSCSAQSGTCLTLVDTSGEDKKKELGNFLNGLKEKENKQGSGGFISGQPGVSNSPFVATAKSRTMTNSNDPMSKAFLGSIPVSSSRSIGDKDDGKSYLVAALNAVSRSSPVKSIQEYQLDEVGKVFLRVEDGARISNPEAVLEKIKQILNIKEK